MNLTDVVVLVNSDHADTPYDVWTQDTAVRPWLLVSDLRRDGYLGMDASLPAPRWFESWATNMRVDLAAYDLVRCLGAAAVIARSEPDVLRAARLRDAFTLPGQSWESAVAFRDKVVMKRILGAHGIAVPDHVSIDVGADLVHFVRRHGYPVVVKPVTGSGSLHTRVLRGDADLLALVECGPEVPMEVETFVEGRMYHVDGLVVDGRLVGVFPSAYLNDCLSFQSGMWLGSCLLLGSDPLHDRLVECARQVLDALPTPDSTTFHIEIWHTPDDRLVVCEAASRTGGARVNSTVKHATGLDLDRAWFASQVGISGAGAATSVEVGRCAGWLLLYPEAGTLEALPEDDPPPFVVESRTHSQIGERYAGGYKSGDYLSAYVLEGATPEEVSGRILETAAWFTERVRWG